MNSIINYLSSTFHYKIYSSVFRVLLFGLLFTELWFNHQSIFFFVNEIKSIELENKSIVINFIVSNYVYFYLLYSILLIAGILGIGKNLTVILIFFTFSIQNKVFPYGIWIEDILYLNLLFFCFIDSFYYFSVRTSKDNLSQNQNLISNLAVYCIAFHTCFIYLNNSLGKLQSDSWLSGQAVYFLSEEYNAIYSTLHRDILSNLFISKYLGYVVVFHQFTFSFLIFVKKTKIIPLILGILIHSTLAFFFLLVKFQLTMIFLYGFFFNDDEIKTFLKNRFPQRMKFFNL